MDGEMLIQRLTQAVNDHDIERVVACFSGEYVNETPVHPARGFRGREQVRRNWDQIFAFVPDIRATVLHCTADDPLVWTEWEMAGTRRDGSAHLMRGVVLFSVSDHIERARFYLEPVDDGQASVDDAIRDQVARQ
jgi:ketosteroid isomerase-like protein